MFAMLGKAISFIDTHPRLILMLGWPIFSAFVMGFTWIIWKGPWPATSADHQLTILGYCVWGFVGMMGLGYLAQSMALFGRLGLKVGNFVDVNAGDERTK
jgi:hypothetical protein